jgi:hypothetical protein
MRMNFPSEESNVLYQEGMAADGVYIGFYVLIKKWNILRFYLHYFIKFIFQQNSNLVIECLEIV